MACSVTLVILLAGVTQAIAEKTDSMEKLVDNFVDNLFDRTLKAGNLALPQRASLRTAVGALPPSTRSRRPVQAGSGMVPQNTARPGHGWPLHQAPQMTSSSIDSDISRRQLFWLSGFTAVGLTPGMAKAADPKKDAALLSKTSAQLKAVVKNIDQITAAVADPTLEVTLPAQVSISVLQKLAKSAHDVQLPKALAASVDTAAPDDDVGGAFMPAGDFENVAAEYARHAGAARDYFKLARLGRQGWSGSDGVAKDYADKWANEIKEASALLEVLSLAVN